MPTRPGCWDVSVLAEHPALGDLAEPLGFHSLFALEYQFTGYSTSPDPVQLLIEFAGRTRRTTFGAAVIVLPWRDPVRVAEQIALLDIVSDGRCVFGFGRGAASVECAGFRVPMEEARVQVVESARIVIKAITFSDGHLANVKGYEFHGGMAKTYSKMKDESYRKKATEFYVRTQVVARPTIASSSRRAAAADRP